MPESNRPPSLKFKPREERLRRVREATQLSLEGWKPSRISRHLKMDIRTVRRILKGNAPLRDEVGEVEANPITGPAPGVFLDEPEIGGDSEEWTPPPPFTPQVSPQGDIPEKPPSESESVQFLRDARDNHRIPWAERIKCALAVAKLESGGDEGGWVAPSDPELWAEALRDAIEVQPPEVMERLLTLLVPPKPPIDP